MKKLALAALTLAVTFTSCIKGETSPSEQYILLLTSLESRTTTDAYIWEFGYSEIDSLKVKSKLDFRSIPVLREQTMAGDTISSITYGYSKNAISLKVNSISGTRIDSLKFDNQLMASELYVNKQPTPYFIKYDNEGYRTAVQDMTLKVSNYTYANAIHNDKDVISYEYTNVLNSIGIQQFGIVGSKYFWPSDRFGRQSRYLLNSVKILENEAIATYKFKYEFNENGLIKEETITRDEKPFMTNKYTYKMGIIRY